MFNAGDWVGRSIAAVPALGFFDVKALSWATAARVVFIVSQGLSNKRRLIDFVFPHSLSSYSATWSLQTPHLIARRSSTQMRVSARDLAHS